MKQRQVFLRAMEPEDLELLYRIENHDALWTVGATSVPYSRYVLHDYMANSSNDIYTDKQVRFMIDNEDKETIGIVDLVNFDPQHSRAEVSIIIETPFQGLGYGCLALESLIAYARRILHLHQLYAVISMSNQVSLRVFQEKGFQQSLVLSQWLWNGKDYEDACMMQFFL